MKHYQFSRISFSFLLVIILGSLLLTGCGSGGGTTTAGTTSCGNPPTLSKSKGLKVGFSQNATNSPWRVAETTSMKNEAAKRGDQIIVTDAANSDAKQVSDIQSLISQKVDVLIVAPLTETAEVPAILAAKKACIPVFLVDRDADHKLATPNHDYITFLGSDFVQQAKIDADWLIQATGGTAKIIELEGTSGASPAILRKQGFDNEIASHPGMKILASQDANFDRDTARQVTQTLLQAHPDVTAIYAANDEMALGAIAALKAAGKQPGKDVLVCSIDGESDGQKAILAGEEGSIVTSSPFFGPITFDAIANYAKGQKLSDWIVVHDVHYTKDNVSQYLSQGF